MSWIQKFFIATLPASWAKSMEAESRRWHLKCQQCGFEKSYWESGGIRWKAKGNPLTLAKCPHCGQKSWHQTYLKETGGPKA